MPCCISISVLVCVCHYEWLLSQIILFLISHLITHFPDAHYGFQCSCYIIHGGDVFAVNHWLFTTCYRFFFLHLIMHLISHNSFCVFPVVSHDSLLGILFHFSSFILKAHFWTIVMLSDMAFHGLLRFFDFLCSSDVKSYYGFSFSHLIIHFFESASQYEYFFTSHFQFPVLLFAVHVHFHFTAWFCFSISLCTFRSN